MSHAQLIERLERAHEVVVALCRGDVRWTMSIPARPESDPDLVIGEALREAMAAVRALL